MIVFFFSVRLPPPKRGDGREDLVNIRAGRFESTVAEGIGNKALRFGGFQLLPR